MKAPSNVEHLVVDEYPDPPVRALGLGLGLVVGGLFALVGLVIEPPGLRIPAWPASLVAGGLGGFIVAPAAWRAATGLGALGIVVGLALLAVVIGDVTMVATSIQPNAGTSPEAAPLALRVVAAGALFIALGLLVAGPAVLPFTLAAAALWMAGMVIARWALSPGPHGPRPLA